MKTNNSALYNTQNKIHIDMTDFYLHFSTYKMCCDFVIFEVKHASYTQDRQCTYKVTMRRIHAMIAAVEKQ